MLAVCLLPVYIIINCYLYRWLCRFMGSCHKWFKKKWIKNVTLGIYCFFASSLVVGFLLPTGVFKRFFMLIGNYFLGVLIYVILVVIAADVIRFFLKRSKHINQERLSANRTFVMVGTFCLILIISISLFGVYNARIIHTTKYDVVVKKNPDKISSLKIVLLADLHLGYNIGTYQMKNMVQKINREKPDLVVIAGDIFDNDYEALDHPEKLISILKGITSKYGVYACYGNHDIKEKILAGFTFDFSDQKVSDKRMDQLLEASNIVLLRDEGVLIDDSFYVYGRPDKRRPGRGINKRKSAKELVETMNKEKPIIVLDHEPNDLKALQEAGVDLTLSGHTHDGQLFPGNIMTRLMWENSYGYLQKGSMHNIVTSGVGLFGPNMRVGTKAEIAVVNVTFS